MLRISVGFSETYHNLRPKEQSKPGPNPNPKTPNLALSASIAMATARLLLLRHRRSPIIPQPLRHLSTSSSPTRRFPPPRPHEFSSPSDFLGSWDPPSSPREAEARLDRLRKGYAKKVKEVRRAYAYEMDLLRAEKERRDEARREAARVANEQRKKEKAAAAESRAVERRAFEEEFRQMLMKERAQKLESWRAKEEMREKKKEEGRELLRKQTSVWVSEENMEKRILEAIVDTTPL